MAKKPDIPYTLYKRGEIWHVYFSFITDSGQRVQFRKSSQRTDRTQADLWAYETFKEILHNIPKPGELAPISVDNAFGIYWNEHCRFQSSPEQSLSRLNILKKELGVKYLHEITESLIKSFIARRRRLPDVQYKRDSYELSNATINRYLALLSGCVKYHKKNYKTDDCHILSLKLPENSENVKYFKDMDTINLLIERAAPHIRPVILTCLYTGLRIGNVTKLTWDAIDFDNDLIHVHVKDKNTQNGKYLVLPMIEQLKTLLKEQPKINAYVFNYQNAPFKRFYSAWRHIFYVRKNKNFLKDSKGNYVLRDKNLPYLNPHALRHTAATWILKSTGNIRVVQKILGHSSVRMTEKYAHVLKDQEKAALQTTFSPINSKHESCTNLSHTQPETKIIS